MRHYSLILDNDLFDGEDVPSTAPGLCLIVCTGPRSIPSSGKKLLSFTTLVLNPEGLVSVSETSPNDTNRRDGEWLDRPISALQYERKNIAIEINCNSAVRCPFFLAAYTYPSFQESWLPIGWSELREFIKNPAHRLYWTPCSEQTLTTRSVRWA